MNDQIDIIQSEPATQGAQEGGNASPAAKVIVEVEDIVSSEDEAQEKTVQIEEKTDEIMLSNSDLSMLEGKNNASNGDVAQDQNEAKNDETIQPYEEFSPAPAAAIEAAAAESIFTVQDDSSVKTEESAEESDSDSVSTESSDDSSSSSSSEDPSVIGGVKSDDVIWEQEDSSDDEEEGRHFTIDDEDEEDERDAILLKEDVHPDLVQNKSPLFQDPELGKTKSRSEKKMRQRAMVRMMVLYNMKGRMLRRRREADHTNTPRDIPLYWDDEAAPIPPKTRGWTHRKKQRRFCYIILSVVILTLGVSLMIYGIARQKEYSRSQASIADDEYNYDDYYYYDDEYDDRVENSAIEDSENLLSPSNNAQPTSPPVVIKSELLELLTLAYKSALASIPPTTETLHIIDLVETDLLNPNVQTTREISEQSVQWRAYTSLLQRDDVTDKTTQEPILQEELVRQLYSLTCFFYNFGMAQNEENECQWTGIKCDDVLSDADTDVLYSSSEDLRVISITLPNQSLTGTLPVELIFLSHLETIDLSNNYISGPLPAYFSSEQLESLKVLSFHDNRFEGSIPPMMSKLKNLQKLTLQHNELVGEVTNEICDLRDLNLHFLWVDCSTMPSTGLPKVPCPADCCSICFEGYDHDGGSMTGGSSPSSQVDTPHIVIADWAADVKQKLSSLSSDGGVSLMDINSPQFHAYGWLVEDSDGKEYSDERLYQRYALAALYFSTGGVQWTNNEGWVTSIDECNWFGISGCENADSDAVISIELAGNNLAGSLSSEFFEYFSDLLVLNLSANRLTGSIPSSVGSLTSLNILELADNELTSHIPSELGNLSKLDHLFLQKNNLEGQMPSEVCSLRTDNSFGLTLLWSDCNGFPPRVQCKQTCCTTCFINPINPGESDVIEAPITHADPDRNIFSTLKRMAPDGGVSLNDTTSSQYKAYNWLAGSDVASLTDIILLQRYALATLYFSTAGSGWKEDFFWLSDTNECPTDEEHWIGVERCDDGGMITQLKLHSNRLVGTLPLELSHLRMLQVMDLSDNELYGSIPTEFGQFQELEVLQLSGNSLSGSIPDDLGFVFTLQELYLHNNAISGSIPAAICELKDPMGGMEILWADCGGEHPAVTCRQYCCTECFTNTSEYVVSASAEDASSYYPTLMPSLSSQTANPTIAENPELKSFLLEHMDGFEDSLSDVNLPAYRAYLLIANADNYSDLDPFNILQRFGLITLYLSTTPDFDWKVSTGWTSKQHECSWFGISCSDNNTVSEISLPNNRLSGTLPHEIALAGIGEQIVYLDFSGNNIGGKIVSELGTLKNLALLDLRANDFTGRIPSQIGHLTKLGTLQLHANELTGDMPSEICALRADKLNMLVADCNPEQESDEVICEEPTCCTRCY